ncbi:MAG: hypothetical protein ACRENP_11575 [Longimicrobiales bacterium]
MIAVVTLFVVTGAVLLFRPITKRLGAYLEVLAEERRRAQMGPPADDTRVLNALESMERRMARLEERQAFTDALLAGRKPAELPGRIEEDRVDRS